MAERFPSTRTGVLGVTGGIASGKSTVSKILRDQCDAKLIDADKLGHQSYEPGQLCYRLLLEEFGKDILAQDETIDRKKLGAIIFNNADKRKRLEELVWPAIRHMAEEKIKAYKIEGTKCVVLEAAVMIEAGWNDIVDELWVVSTDQNTAIERLQQRNGLSVDQAMARINAQISNKEREAFANVVIHTNGTLEELEEKVVRIFNEYYANEY